MEEWEDVLETPIQPTDPALIVKGITARLLENQKNSMTESIGNVTGGIEKWDPILISMIRRSVPKMVAFDIFGVQPMNAPTGLIFSLRSHYNDSTGDEALFDEVNSGFSGLRDDMTTKGSTPTWEGRGVPDGTVNDPLDPTYGYGVGMPTEVAERLGDSNAWNEMGFSIEKKIIEAKSRALKTSWSTELEEDLKSVHGIEARPLLTNILSTEMINELNRETVRRAYVLAKQGCLETTTTGEFDLNIDSDGRWAVEKFKGLIFQIEKEANQIAIETRRGKGNVIVTSANVASALAMTGKLDTGGTGKDFVTPSLVDPTQTTYVGMMNNSVKVLVDPYSVNDFLLIGYKGSNIDAGAYYCPYVPLTLFSTIGEDDFSKRIGFKQRYAISNNPFAGDGSPSTNPYFRLFGIKNL